MEKEQNLKIRVHTNSVLREITNHLKVETEASTGPCAQKKATSFTTLRCQAL